MNAIVSTVVPRPAFGKKKKKMSEAPKNTTQCQKICLKIMKNKQYLLTIKPIISTASGALVSTASGALVVGGVRDICSMM